MHTTTKKISAREYENLPEGPPSQLINGEVIMSPSPSALRQLIVGELYSLLKNYVTQKTYGTVILSPIDVFLSETDVFQPDIIFISNENKDIIRKNIKGIPDLIVEVLSPSTAYYDLVYKKNMYEEKGVKEYWTVDYEGKGIEVYENVDGKFILFSKARVSGSFVSKILLDFSIKLEELFSNLPSS